jgi:two-component system, chemotaxis family, protein-glutamate methylesterase/glutaminase
MIRVLVVDDSPLQRQLLVETLKQDVQIEVVGTAADGYEAVAMVEALRPDLITMDIQMPKMDGYRATEEIMIHNPTPIVIVSGSESRPDMDKTMNSLKAGALTVITKPSSVQSSQFDAWAKLLLETVKSMAEVQVIRKRKRALPEPPPPIKSSFATKPKAVAIVSSTGGPQALHRLLSGLESFPLPIFIVQHISASFLGGFAGWLDAAVSLPVRIATHLETVRPGTIYLAPENRHMGVTLSGTIQCWDTPPVDGFKPSGTVLFHSMAEAYGSETLAIILTGMGRDGVDGLGAIRKAKGAIVAQDEKSSVVFGMPKAAIDAGLADEVLSLDQIAGLLERLAVPP